MKAMDLDGLDEGKIYQLAHDGTGWQTEELPIADPAQLRAACLAVFFIDNGNESAAVETLRVVTLERRAPL